MAFHRVMTRGLRRRMLRRDVPPNPCHLRHMATTEPGTSSTSSLPRCRVTVLVPHVETSDPNLAYYSDFSQSHAEYVRVFAELGLGWHWQPVTLADYEEVIVAAAAAAAADGSMAVFLNLCDGDEVNGVPGLSVVRLLDTIGACYTGADQAFYETTTSKLTMKQCFADADVPTAPWASLTDSASCDGVRERCGTPLIVKPAVSAGSMGITLDSVVHTDDALRAKLASLGDGYRGWDLVGGGVLAERFIVGREFTTFVIGSADAPERAMVYPAVERVFNRALPPTEQFLSFDRLWEIYEREAPLPDQAYLWEYAAAPAHLGQALTTISWAAYVAVGGRGYGRIDLRLDATTGELFVLEVNAQCGLSDDEDFTSIGAILRYAQRSFTDAIRSILAEAVHSHALKRLST